MKSPDKVKCKKCHGHGWIVKEVEMIEISVSGMNHTIPGNPTTTVCDFCKGKGELDWIENVVGVTYDPDPWWPSAGRQSGMIQQAIKYYLEGEQKKITLVETFKNLKRFIPKIKKG